MKTDPFSENMIKLPDPEMRLECLELVFCDRENVRLNLIFKEGITYLSIMTNPKHIDLQQYDRIVLTLANDEKLMFMIQGEQLQCNIGKFRFCFYIKLFKEDFDILCNSDIVAIHIFAATPYDIKNFHFSHCFFITFLKACMELNSNWNPDAEDGEVNAPCYVCLMTEPIMGFYMIHVMNESVCREFTLPGKKVITPIICNHQYPTRRIAKSIQSDLYCDFAAKHRGRGRFFDLFDLDKNDVEQIKAILR